jgi:hypothetical protein
VPRTAPWWRSSRTTTTRTSAVRWAGANVWPLGPPYCAQQRGRAVRIPLGAGEHHAATFEATVQQKERAPVARIGYQYLRMARADGRIPMTFEYRGAIYSTKDITHDPVWEPRARDWEMRLMDFRLIQPKSPNSCRW